MAIRHGLILLALAVAGSGLRADETVADSQQQFDAFRQSYEDRLKALEDQVQQQAPARGALVPPTPSDFLDELPTNLTESAVYFTPQEIAAIRTLINRATLDFQFQGYFRSGLGIDGQGKAFSAFRAPYSEAKYRLGNEAETYLETAFITKLAPETAGENVTFDTIARLAYVTPNSNNRNFDATTSLREAFSTATGVLPGNPTATFWAGQRYYSRYDVHINDFFYYDMSGFGGGIEKVTLADGQTKFAMAWLGGSIDTLRANGTGFLNPDDRFNKNNLETSLTEIPVPGGTLDVHVTVAHFSGETIQNETGEVELASTIGQAVSLMYSIPIGESGKNVLAAQYGGGASFNFSSQMIAPTALDSATVPALNTSQLRTRRLLDNVIWDINQRWTVQGVIIYQDVALGTEAQSNVTWVSAGVRPEYHFNRYFSLATEVGYDHTDKEDAENGSLVKVTIAPQIAPQALVMSRPVLRAFFTYAWWTEGFRGLVGVPSYTANTEGLSAGVQVETWW